jgi:hypothetical protein
MALSIFFYGDDTLGISMPHCTAWRIVGLFGEFKGRLT